MRRRRRRRLQQRRRHRSNTRNDKRTPHYFPDPHLPSSTTSTVLDHAMRVLDTCRDGAAAARGGMERQKSRRFLLEKPPNSTNPPLWGISRNPFGLLWCGSQRFPDGCVHTVSLVCSHAGREALVEGDAGDRRHQDHHLQIAVGGVPVADDWVAVSADRHRRVPADTVGGYEFSVGTGGAG